MSHPYNYEKNSDWLIERLSFESGFSPLKLCFRETLGHLTHKKVSDDKNEFHSDL